MNEFSYYQFRNRLFFNIDRLLAYF